MTSPRFLSLDEVLGIHADQVGRYGGLSGLQDVGLLKSALGVPESTFEGEFLHGSTSEQAAAYLYHIIRNHPFADGNKRTALMSALVFLGLNGLRLRADPDALYRLVDGVAAGVVSKAEVAVFLQAKTGPR